MIDIKPKNNKQIRNPKTGKSQVFRDRPKNQELAAKFFSVVNLWVTNCPKVEEN